MHLSFILLFLMGTTSNVHGVTNMLANASNSRTSRCNKTPVNNCNCQCTVNQDSRAIRSLEAKVKSLINNNTSCGSDAMKSLEAKVESLIGLINKTSGVSDAVKSLEAKVESLVNNNTSSGSDVIKSLEAKVESLINNNTSSGSDAIKSLEAKVEKLIGLISKTSGVSDTVKSLEAKVESLINNNTSCGSDAIKSLTAKVESLIGMNNKTSGVSDVVKSLESKMESLIGLINRTSSFFSTPALKPAAADVISSCKEQYAKDNSSRSQVFTLKFGLLTIPVYCHMGDFGCGGGGWTLAMKTDGTKKTFHYWAKLWTNKIEYNLAGGKTGFDTQETKLPTYWETNFSKICLGMRIGNQANFITINKQASSLYSLIADGMYRPTNLGRNYWKTLIGSQASLQRNCNREGFNADCLRTDTNNKAMARIGILGNNENHCVTADSRIGFGMQGVPDDSNTCGNAAKNGDNGRKLIKSFGYILVQ